MKKLNNYQRVAQYLVKIFKMVNEEYFSGELEVPTVSIQSTVGAYGHVSVNKIWHNAESSTHELNLSADYLNRPIENVVATLIHEGCHLYAMQHGIKDTSNQGVYHNKRFKELAEDRGLVIDRHVKYGWTLTDPSEDTIDFCIRNGLEDIEIFRQSFIDCSGISGLSGTKTGDGSSAAPRPRKPTSTRKYICPCCGNSFRATKDLRVLCMDCNTQYVISL